MFDLARNLISMAMEMGAQFAEGRVVEQSKQSITSTDSKSNVSETRSHGFGIRVLVDGHWGFSSADLLRQDQAQKVVKEAVTLARVMPKRSRTVQLAKAEVIQDSYETPCKQDPFSMPVSEKVECAHSITQAMLSTSDKVSRTSAKLDFWREISYLVTSEGTEIEQTLTVSGLAMAVMVEDNGQLIQRTYPDPHGDYRTRGFEHISAHKPLVAAKQIVHEAVELLDAPPCENEITTVILGPSMLKRLLHETVGHPIELDRALGDETDNFGPTFLRPSASILGNFQFGSELITIVADATRPGCAGTYGYDHEGVPAQKFPVIERGVFVNFLQSRESAYEIGQQSNGTSRANGWNRIPMIRITNLCLVPGEYTKEQLIAGTDKGLYIETAKGCDVGENRVSYSVLGERGWRIRNGRIIGLVKNPVIYGEGPTLWRHCTGVAGPEEDQVIGGYCGKGLPWQRAWTGEGGPPARFDLVKVGSASTIIGPSKSSLSRKE